MDVFEIRDRTIHIFHFDTIVNTNNGPTVRLGNRFPVFRNLIGCAILNLTIVFLLSEHLPWIFWGSRCSNLYYLRCSIV